MACLAPFSKKGVCPAPFSKKAGAGFTFIEILVVLGISALLLGSLVIALGVLRDDSDLQAEARAFSRALELARSRTIASEGDATYGVYVDGAADRYILFEGSDYASRASEEVFQLRDTIEFDAVTFGGEQEVTFDRIQGTTSRPGSAQLREKTNPTIVKTVYVEASGAVAIDSSLTVSDEDRVTDSRHTHIDYTGRIIDTTIETIVLDFGVATETIVMQDNLIGGQIVWEGVVTADGEPQTLKIHTHKLNDGFDSQFSVHRDRTMNTKPLTIEIGVISGPDPDPDSGTIIQYDAAGLVTPGTSAYVLPGATQEQ